MVYCISGADPGNFPNFAHFREMTAFPPPGVEVYKNPCSFGVVATPSFTFYYMLNGDIMQIGGNGAVIQILTCIIIELSGEAVVEQYPVQRALKQLSDAPELGESQRDADERHLCNE